ncbi:hypothetical protein Ga0466249_004857 [Sporomusaceae bacterium BoRhaA]|nr:hypothetical protein [Pelorhabdus rhamnosifermentans]
MAIKVQNNIPSNFLSLYNYTCKLKKISNAKSISIISEIPTLDNEMGKIVAKRSGVNPAGS